MDIIDKDGKYFLVIGKIALPFLCPKPKQTK